MLLGVVNFSLPTHATHGKISCVFPSSFVCLSTSSNLYRNILNAIIGFEDFINLVLFHYQKLLSADKKQHQIVGVMTLEEEKLYSQNLVKAWKIL